MKMESTLDGFYDRLKIIRDRICISGVPEVIEIHTEWVSLIGRQALQCLFFDRKDVIPSTSYQIFNWADCLTFGRVILEKLFNGKTGINISTVPLLKDHIRATYTGGGEWLCKLG